MKTIIMAGGRGSRISSLTSDIPKPMIKIGGKPVLEHQIECLKRQGLTELILTISYKKEFIKTYFGNGNKISPVTGEPFGVEITYYEEETPMGNAGALLDLQKLLGDDFMLINGDILFDVDMAQLAAFHKQHKAVATLLTHPNNHPADSSLIIADENGVVREWLPPEEHPQYYKNRVNAGIHMFSPKVFQIFPRLFQTRQDKVDLDRQILKPLASMGKLYCYDSSEYVKDMGTPERYACVCEDMRLGRVASRNHSVKQRAIFLDRDGTINKSAGFINRPEDFELLPLVAEAIRQINSSGYLAVVITNQPVIARGELTEEGLVEIHNKMETCLGKKGAYLDGIYYCPHHPDSGFEGEIKELKINCECRKPKPGMIYDAAEKFNIDLSKSWMIGNEEKDVLAGRSVGAGTVLIGSGEYGQTFTADSLFTAVRKILGEQRNEQMLDVLIHRHPELAKIRCDIYDAYQIMKGSFKAGCKLLVAGNGGSASDAEHITGELMKGFLMERPIAEKLKKSLNRIDPDIGSKISKKLQSPLEVISLTSQEALSTAFMNDVDADYIFAQKVLGYGKQGDVFLAISTSGNSANILNAAITAKALGLHVVGLTGQSGRLQEYCDACVHVPESETYKIQELHLPVYHCWCMMLEECFFGESIEE